MRNELRLTQLYTVYDCVAMDFGPIFESINDGVAVRNYKQMLKDNPYAQDFILYCVGYIQRNNSGFIINGISMEQVPLDKEELDV